MKFSSLFSRLVLPCALAFGVSALYANSGTDSPLDKVNLFIGTGGDYGQLAPGATMPFGMIHVSPDSNPRQHPGYDYEVPVISGFSINRLSGVGGSGCGGNVSILPLTGGSEKVALVKETETSSAPKAARRPPSR